MIGLLANRLSILCGLLAGVILTTACPFAHADGGTWPPVGELTGGLAVDMVVHGSYAYVTTLTAVTIVDISVPSQPRMVGHLDTSLGSVTGVAVAESCAYVAEGSSGLLIVDVSDPSHPLIVGTYAAPASHVDVQGAYAYVTGSEGLKVLDISSPLAPVEVGSLALSPAAGCVAVVGRYAYLARGTAGICVVDVDDPTHPVQLGACETPGEARRVAVLGGCAYVADDLGGLRVIDVSDPARPGEVGCWGASSVRAGDVTVVGSYALLADYSHGLHIIDVSDSAHPQKVGDCLTRKISAVVAVGQYACIGGDGIAMVNVSDPGAPIEVGAMEAPATAFHVAASGGYAYVPNGPYNGLRVVDVSDPAHPVQATSVDLQAWDVKVLGQRAYVTEGGTTPSLVYILDVSDPASPVQIGASRSPGATGGLDVAGGYAYVLDLLVGLRVVDVTDSANPVQVGQCSLPYLPPADIAVSGGYAYVADQASGLRIIDVSSPDRPVEVGQWIAPGNSVYDVVVDGQYAYVCDYGSGLHVLDLSSPASPLEIGHVSATAAAVALDDGFAYLCTADSLRVLDVSDPTQPVDTGYYWDTPGRAIEVVVSAGYVYVADADWGLMIFPVVSTGVISGQVRRRDGDSNIPGASVEAYAGGELKGSAITDTTGIYAISGLRCGTYTVKVHQTGYVAQAKAGVSVKSSRTTYANFSLDASGRLTGQVRVKATAANVSGATVQMILGGQVKRSVATNTMGIYLADSDLPAGAYTVSVSKVGYVTQSKAPITVTAGTPSYVNFMAFEQLPPIKGQVCDRGTAAALEGATVAAYRDGVLAASVTTGADGVYAMGSDLPAGTYVVTASRSGYLVQTKASVIVHAADTTYVNFALERVPALRGQVVDRRTGAVLVGARVVAYLPGGGATTTTTDDKGLYEISARETGSWTVAAVALEYEPQTKGPVTVTEDSTTYVNFGLNRMPVIGWVTDASGQALAGATVQAYRGDSTTPVASVVSTAGGAYGMPASLPAGTYAVVAFADGHVRQTKSNVVVTDGQTARVSFSLYPVCIKGQVKAAGTTTNLAGATVTVYDGSTVKATATTNATGIYEIGGVAGTFTLIAFKAGYVHQTKLNITHEAGPITYVNFSLAISGKLRGQVKDKVANTPIIGATVVARMGGVVRATATTTAPYGVYEIASDLPEGTYTLIGSKDGYLNQGRLGIAVTAGATTNVNFTLQPQ